MSRIFIVFILFIHNLLLFLVLSIKHLLVVFSEIHNQAGVTGGQRDTQCPERSPPPQLSQVHNQCQFISCLLISSLFYGLFVSLFISLHLLSLHCFSAGLSLSDIGIFIAVQLGASFQLKRNGSGTP